MAELGVRNTLCVVREKEQGLYLDAGDLGEILLPHSDSNKRYNRGDMVDVFVYRDSEDRLIATSQRPYAEVGDFAFLKVVSVTKIGAFLDWGLPKDLFVPLREQQHPMKEGKSYVVYLYIDKRTDRIVASSNLNKLLEDESADEFTIGQKVELMLCERTELGYRAIVDGTCWGLLYQNEVFQEVFQGGVLDGYVKKVRADGKLDLSLYPSGYEKIKGFSKDIIEMLQQNDGFLPLHDKSPPDEIYNWLKMSKKNFKKSIGGLFKQRLIRIDSKGIHLSKK